MQPILVPLLISFLAIPTSAAAQALDGPGPHAVGRREVQFVDAQFGRGTVAARMLYPAQFQGQGAPADPGSGPYPLIAFLHGFFGAPRHYDEIAGHLASWGFVVAIHYADTTATANMASQGADGQALLHWMDAESADPAAWLADMAAPGDWIAVGHSMGGGAALFLAGLEPRVRHILSLEPYKGPRFGGSDAASNVLQSWTGNIQFVAGSVDTVTPWTQAYDYFLEAASARRNLFLVMQGAGHIGLTDLPPDNEPLPGAEQQRLHRRIVAAFLRAELYGEEQHYAEMYGEPAAAEPLLRQVDCLAPPLWAGPSLAQAGELAIGLAGNPLDRAALAWSLATNNRQTQWGTLGIDLGAGAVFHQLRLDAGGVTEALLPVQVGWSGQTLYLQGISIPAGALTRVAALPIP